MLICVYETQMNKGREMAPTEFRARWKSLASILVSTGKTLSNKNAFLFHSFFQNNCVCGPPLFHHCVCGTQMCVFVCVCEFQCLKKNRHSISINHYSIQFSLPLFPPFIILSFYSIGNPTQFGSFSQ